GLADGGGPALRIARLARRRRAPFRREHAHAHRSIPFLAAEHRQRLGRQIGGAGVDTKDGGAFAALLLRLPGGAAVGGGDDRAAFADRPTLQLIAEENAVEGKRLAGLEHLPTRALVGG